MMQNKVVVIKVDDSEYLESTLISEINSKITALITEPGTKKPVFVEAGFSSKPGVKITVDNTGGGSTYHYIVDFAVDKYGNIDKYNTKAKLVMHQVLEKQVIAQKRVILRQRNLLIY